MKPTLYIVSTSIGNPLDLGERAKQILRKADLVIGEEFKTTSKLLKQVGAKQDFELLNEHSSSEEIENLFTKIQNANTIALFSDAGTPILEDPGLNLVQKCIRKGILIEPIPGPSAVLGALVVSGFTATPFSFLGFLPRETEDRKRKMKEYLKIRHVLVFYETPYRYKKAFLELKEIIPKEKKIFLGIDLTLETSTQFHGTWGELLTKIETFPKGNPVLVLDNH